jgi:hypothetical protein
LTFIFTFLQYHLVVFICLILFLDAVSYLYKLNSDNEDDLEWCGGKDLKEAVRCLFDDILPQFTWILFIFWLFNDAASIARLRGAK